MEFTVSKVVSTSTLVLTGGGVLTFLLLNNLWLAIIYLLFKQLSCNNLDISLKYQESESYSVSLTVSLQEIFISKVDNLTSILVVVMCGMAAVCQEADTLSCMSDLVRQIHLVSIHQDLQQHQWQGVITGQTPHGFPEAPFEPQEGLQ